MQQPVDRVSHVVFCLRPESIPKAIEFWRALGVELEDATRPELGLRVLISLANGIEIVSPDASLGTEPPARFIEFLNTHGEGVTGFVYGVRDLDAAASAVESLGLGITHRGSFADKAPWIGRFDRLDEAHVEHFMGTHVTLGQIEPRG